MTTPTTPTPTPRRSLARLRPSGAATPNVPPVPPPMLSPETLLARKASFNQLTQNSSKDSGYGGDSDGGLEIGDKVNVPGGMYGVVKFVGNVKGKPGVFVGVELEGPHAVNGKNDGTVEGTRYFTTSVPHSGIFLPLSRATPRHSGSSIKSGSDTPSVITSPAEDSPPQPPKKPFARPSLPRPQSPGGRNITPRPGLIPTTPGQRSGSSLSNRMFSPSPTPGNGRNRAASISSNATDGGPPGPGASRLGNRPAQTPSRGTLRPGFNANKSHPPLPREPPRAGSAMSYTNDVSSADGMTPKINGSGNAMNSTTNGAGLAAKLTRMSQENNMSKEEEDKGMIAILQAKLSAKDHQLKEQANNLLEMESSLNELQSLLTDGVAAQQQQQQSQTPTPSMHGAGHGASSISAHSGDGEEELELAQLRHLLRERNDKISQLQSDFDSHRADFRSTIDTLEMAATETERVYEKKVEDLLAELRELERQRQELLEERIRREEEGSMPAGGVESVARQLKQLEALVAELEEGLEDARRGEAEARAEAEHCRGESERAKEELRREREKTMAFERRVDDLKDTVKSVEGDVEKKNDEIRGLKAIMTSLSRGKPPAAAATNGAKDKEKEEEEKAARKKLEDRIRELESLVEKKKTREEELEKEVEQLKVSPLGLKITMPPKISVETVMHEQSDASASPLAKTDSPAAASTMTSPTVTLPLRSSPLTKKPQESPVLTDIDDDEEPSTNSSTAASAAAATPPPPPPKSDQVFCELCEKHGHDILACTEMFAPKPGSGKKDSIATFSTLEKAGMTPLPLNTAGVAGRSSLDHEDDGRSGGVSLGRATTPNPNGGASNGVSVTVTPEPDSEGGLPAVAGKSSGVLDRSKWCALCERDGHDSVDCPIEDF
ncbi:hypothetical protein DRE_02619 [Drechslerella stenobrocha 248]|uniref:CAP-Gly domain-containing protein n=1 Tax=Drechslerella stenobrocha 248 TaxID=1043628 RepID=W7IFW0_9PEZI|nr:hypothetical protein DRE_02619 [Drechslerella stenobrocha 248]